MSRKQHLWQCRICDERKPLQGGKIATRSGEGHFVCGDCLSKLDGDECKRAFVLLLTRQPLLAPILTDWLK